MNGRTAQAGASVDAAPTSLGDASLQARKLSNRLLVTIRDDVAAHDRVATRLRAQEASVVRPSDPVFREATSALESELERLPFRTNQRERIIRDLGKEFAIEPSTLTLRSIAERLGPAGRPLLAEGERLRTSVKEVQRLNRRVAALIRMHRDVTREILNSVLGDGSGRNLLDGGTLIDAEV
ncbi:MAG: hypothetical protein ACJA2W_000083 [Planctomycetota bacterium]|jgi:hypothetical protein